MSNRRSPIFTAKSKQLLFTWLHCDVPFDEILHQLKAVLHLISLDAFFLCAKISRDGSPSRHAVFNTSFRLVSVSYHRLDIHRHGTTFTPTIRSVCGSVIPILNMLRHSEYYMSNIQYEKNEWAPVLALLKINKTTEAYLDAIRLFPHDIYLHGLCLKR